MRYIWRSALLLVALLALGSGSLVLVASGEWMGAEAWSTSNLGPYSYGVVLSISWSPDGGMLVASGESPDVAGSVLYACNGSFAYGLDPGIKLTGTFDVAWSPDGSMIAAASEDDYYNGTLLVFWSNGTLAWSQGLAAVPNSVSWAPNSSMLAVTYGNRTAIFRRSGELVTTLWGPEGSDMWVASWGPSGGLAIGLTVSNYTNTTGYLVLANLSGEIWEAAVGPVYKIVDIAWSPGGDKILAVGRQWVGSSERSIITVHTAGGEGLVNTTINAPIIGLDWPSSGAVLAFSGMTSDYTEWWRLGLLNTTTGEITWSSNHTGEGIFSISASPSGNAIALGKGLSSVLLLGEASQCPQPAGPGNGSTITPPPGGTTQPPTTTSSEPSTTSEQHQHSTSAQTSGSSHSTSSHSSSNSGASTEHSSATQEGGSSGSSTSSASATGLLKRLSDKGISPEMLGIIIIIILLIVILIKK